MLNNSEHNNVMVKVLPVGVEAPDYSKDRKSSARSTISSESFSEIVEDEVVRNTSITIECLNGYIALTGKYEKVCEVFSWLKRLGVHSPNDICIMNDAFHIGYDINDNNYGYTYEDGQAYVYHAAPEKCMGIVRIEPDNDGGRVWRNFEDFDEVEAIIYPKSH